MNNAVLIYILVFTFCLSAKAKDIYDFNWSIVCVDELIDSSEIALEAIEWKIAEPFTASIQMTNCSDRQIMFHIEFDKYSQLTISEISVLGLINPMNAGYAQQISSRTEAVLPGHLPFQLEAGQTKIFALEIRHTESYSRSFRICPKVINDELFRDRLIVYKKNLASWNVFIGLFLGIILAFLAYAIMNWLIYRNTYFGYYAVYIFFTFLFNAHLVEGHPDMNILFSYIPSSLNLMLMPLNTLSIISYILFFLSFLEVKKRESWMHPILIGLITFLALSILMEFVLYAFGLHYKFFYLSLAPRIIGLPFGFWSSIIVLRRKETISSIVATGTIIWITSALMMVVMNILFAKGIFVHLIYENSYVIFQIGTIIELALFTFAINRRIHLDLLSKAKIEQELFSLEKTSSVLKDLYANITHEFRTPLTIIKGYTAKLDSGLGEFKNEINKQCDQLLALVESVLKLSKLDAGLEVYKPKKIELTSYLKYLLESYEHLSGDLDIEFNIDLGKDDVWILADEKKLKMIISNILSNSIKYMSAPGQINVRLTRNDQVCRLDIADTGKGIPADDLAHIFKRYYRAKGHQNIIGSGIGLSIVKEYVDMMAAQIEVQNLTAGGCRFSIVIPTVESEVGDLMQVESLLEPQMLMTKEDEIVGFRNGATENESFEILVVEDNPDVSKYISGLLQENGYTHRLAGDGLEALEQAKASIPNLIIADVMMPRMDGYELCREVRTDKLIDHVPIILVTAKSLQEDKIIGLKEGADAYLVKPFEAEELLLLMSNFLSRQQRLRAYYGNGIPESNGGAGQNQVQTSPFLENIEQMICEELSKPDFGVKLMSDRLFMDRSQLYRKLKSMTGISPTQLIRKRRMERALVLLTENHKTVGEIADVCGYQNISAFTKSFTKTYGQSPSNFRNQRPQDG